MQACGHQRQPLHPLLRRLRALGGLVLRLEISLTLPWADGDKSGLVYKRGPVVSRTTAAFIIHLRKAWAGGGRCWSESQIQQACELAKDLVFLARRAGVPKRQTKCRQSSASRLGEQVVARIRHPKSIPPAQEQCVMGKHGNVMRYGNTWVRTGTSYVVMVFLCRKGVGNMQPQSARHSPWLMGGSGSSGY